jgi:hypothetical protein
VWSDCCTDELAVFKNWPVQCLLILFIKKKTKSTLFSTLFLKKLLLKFELESQRVRIDTIHTNTKFCSKIYFDLYYFVVCGVCEDYI